MATRCRAKTFSGAACSGERFPLPSACWHHGIRCHIPNVLLGWGCSWVGGGFRVWGVIGKEASGMVSFPAFPSSGGPGTACPREVLPRRGRPLATGDRHGRAARARQRRTSGWCQPDTALKIFPKFPCPGGRFPLPCACPSPRCPAAHPERSAWVGCSWVGVPGLGCHWERGFRGRRLPGFFFIRRSGDCVPAGGAAPQGPPVGDGGPTREGDPRPPAQNKRLVPTGHRAENFSKVPLPRRPVSLTLRLPPPPRCPAAHPER